MDLQETSSCFKGNSATTLYHHVKMPLRSTDNTNFTKKKVFLYLDIEYMNCLGTVHIKWQQVISTQSKINSCRQIPSLFHWVWYY